MQPPPAPPATSLAVKAARGGLHLPRRDNHDDTHEIEPTHCSSATARVIEGLELHGCQPSGAERDPRPLPDTNLVAGAISDLFDILGGALRDTSLEPDLDDLLWRLADLFHKKAARAQRQIDDNEDRQRKSQEEQDGSEVRSVELET